MATFPSLVPSGRTFTPGEYPHSVFTTLNGWQNRVRHSNVMLDSQVRLSFIALTEAQMLSILSHYQGQYGGFSSFDLPSNIWSGATTVSDYNLSGYLWRYADPPQVVDTNYGRHDVEITLQTVPPDGAMLDGGALRIDVTFAAGSAAAASGLNRSVALTLAATGFVAVGFDGTVTQSLAGGNAAASNGSAFTVGSSLTTGDAAASSGAEMSITLTLLPGQASSGSAAPSDYWSDMSAQMFGWESLAYIEWWGN
jgi:hypothetical protein